MHSNFFRLPVREGNRLILIDPNDVVYIRASNGYAEIFLGDKKFLSRVSISKLTDQLTQNHFVRIHRSTLINLRFVKELLYAKFGEVLVKMEDDEFLTVSKNSKKELFEALNV